MNSSDDQRKTQSERLAESIQEQSRRKEEIKFQEEWNKRIDIARDGRIAYESSDPVTAVANYKKIISLTARRYGVPVEKLHPKLFDVKSRVNESLLISAIAFDLAKIIERLEGAPAKKDLDLYLRLFVLFSKGMPFEIIATSTIRKYVSYTKGLKNPRAFESAYKELRRGACFIAAVAFDDVDCQELVDLRKFRDQCLWPSVRGQQIIGFYYLVGPIMARIISRVPLLKLMVRFVLRFLIKLINPFSNSRRSKLKLEFVREI